MKYKIINNLKLYLFVILLGGAVGLILWLFLKAIQLCTELLWDTIPGALSGAGPAADIVTVAVCCAGGLLMGLMHWKFGDYPEELPLVLGKIRKNRHYDYHPMLAMIVCAFLPLAFGASVGPEAGLTGIIAGLCYWIGDNVKYAKSHAAEYSDIGAAVMLGTLFSAPLFGIFAVEESGVDAPEDQEEKGRNDRKEQEDQKDRKEPEDQTESGRSITRLSKLLLYGLSAGSALLVMKGLGAAFGAVSEGFPGFEAGEMKGADYALILLYIAAGLILYFAYIYSKKLMGFLAGKIPVILKEAICGFCIGGVAMVLPNVLFSGEDQMGTLPDAFMIFTPAALIGVSFVKIIMTTFCIEFGMKGGHFFPLIFACCCMGFGIALLIFGGGVAGAGGQVLPDVSAASDPAVSDLISHAVLASAVVTAATLGAQLRKPFAATMLLMICFPLRLALWIFVAAAIGGKVGAAIPGGQKSPTGQNNSGGQNSPTGH